MKHYPILDIAPDFTNQPQGGVIVPRSDIRMGQSAIESRWPAFNSRTVAFDFTFRGPSEVNDMRDFLDTVRGAWMPFYIPSWTRDFRVVGAITAGDTTVTVDKDLSALLTANRPDTFGRSVFFHFGRSRTQIFRVLSQAAGDAEGTYDLTLDAAFLFDQATPNLVIAGFAWFARISGDEINWTHLTPDRAYITLGIQETRNTQNKEGEFTLTGSDLYESQAFETIIETDADPLKSDQRSATCLGPFEYSESQGVNFFTAWEGRIEDGEALLSSDNTAEFASTLYDDDDSVEFFTFAFDVAGNEVIAWQDSNPNSGTFHLKYFDGSEVALEIDGKNPVLFQNWTINGAISGGDGDVIVYYLKENDSKVFARYQRDDYDTEYTVIISPIMPLCLTGFDFVSTQFRLHGISATHNLLTFLSDDYTIPLPPQADAAQGEATSPTGDYIKVQVSATATDDPIEGTVEGPTGVYAIVPPPPEIEGDGDDAASGSATSPTGSYVDRVVPGSAGPDQAEGSADSPTGVYKLTAQEAQIPEESASGDATISGTYEEDV